jgi:hypothetical protein
MPKLVTFVTYHFGEVSYTSKDIISAFDPANPPDFTKTKTCIVSSDDYRLTQVQAYGTIEIEIPDWLDPTEYISNRFEYRDLWSHGISIDASEPVQRSLLGMHGDYVKACAKLINTKIFRSSFRQSLYNQLMAWINTPEDKRRYDTPFSSKQWQCIDRKNY